jgi:hypothetical protein
MADGGNFDAMPTKSPWRDKSDLGFHGRKKPRQIKIMNSQPVPMPVGKL